MNNKKNTTIILLCVLAVLVGLVFFSLQKKTVKTQTETKVPVAETINVSDSDSNEFDDGLHNPTDFQKFAPDAYGAGVVERAEYSYDINGDGRPDKITRTRLDTETAHFSYIYKIELNKDGKMIDITPRDFQTIEGADCSRQKFRFSFVPAFSVVKISRPLGDTWNTPTASTKTTYGFWNEAIKPNSKMVYKTVCDVSELF